MGSLIYIVVVIPRPFNYFYSLAKDDTVRIFKSPFCSNTPETHFKVLQSHYFSICYTQKEKYLNRTYQMICRLWASNHNRHYLLLQCLSDCPLTSYDSHLLLPDITLTLSYRSKTALSKCIDTTLGQSNLGKLSFLKFPTCLRRAKTYWTPPSCRSRATTTSTPWPSCKEPTNLVRVNAGLLDPLKF